MNEISLVMAGFQNRRLLGRLARKLVARQEKKLDKLQFVGPEHEKSTMRESHKNLHNILLDETQFRNNGRNLRQFRHAPIIARKLVAEDDRLARRDDFGWVEGDHSGILATERRDLNTVGRALCAG